jgi:hypothetical protein
MFIRERKCYPFVILPSGHIMSLFFSLSKAMTALTASAPPRLAANDAGRPGMQAIVTHSTQISWQWQALKLDAENAEPIRGTRYDTGHWLVMAIEAYSRYTLMMVYRQAPAWHQVEDDFNRLWLEQMLTVMNGAGVAQAQTAADHIARELKLLGKGRCVQNLDPSIGGHIRENHKWIWAYLRDNQPEHFATGQALELSQYLNHLPRKIKTPDGSKTEFLPYERFLLDSLYRFASGLCQHTIPSTRNGNFPNPHRAEPKLEIVSANASS